MQVKYSEKYCKHQLSQKAILEGSQITVNVTRLCTWNKIPVTRDCHNLLRKEKLQELALPRLALRDDFFPLFSRQKEPGSRYAMKKQKYQFRSALDIKAIDCVDREWSSFFPESEKV